MQSLIFSKKHEWCDEVVEFVMNRQNLDNFLNSEYTYLINDKGNEIGYLIEDIHLYSFSNQILEKVVDVCDSIQLKIDNSQLIVVLNYSLKKITTITVINYEGGN
ncbi:hypothetical protein [Paenimyroides baculatum]|uniref:Uncharacterized protein n=1 Tax=Paenimyroides baculatum TaxID=2608000 RepID=A0A5M6CMF0_9FLAO|nr:hypothetical protein [Paenimyroides baculatum]KAA5534319.1 hypothetical protein F0460_09430 [Paenimyroides baculatum]